MTRPIVAWTVFGICSLIPAAIILFIALYAAKAHTVWARNIEMSQRATVASNLRRDIELEILRSQENLRSLDSDASKERVRGAKIDFADAFQATEDGPVWMENSNAEAWNEIREGVSRHRKVMDTARSNLGLERSAKLTDDMNGGPNVILLRWGKAVISARRFANGETVGYVFHLASVRRDAPQRIISDFSYVVSPQDKPAVVDPTIAKIMTLSGPPVAKAPDFDEQCDVRLTPTLAVKIEPRNLERQLAHTGRNTLGTACFVVVFALVLSTIFFARYRRAQRLAELRTDFVAAVSHELRTPLASVRMFAELLEAGDVTPEERPEVEKNIATESRRLSSTLERMMRFGALSRGKLVADKAMTKLEPVIKEAIAHRPGVETEVDPALEVKIDVGLIHLALDNLLGNAVKYAKAPIRVHAKGIDEKQFSIEVSDSGPGISKRAQKRIFLPFERADARLSKHTEGTGVGLALVRGIAKAHGGDCTVKSDVGSGSTFTLLLPRL